MIKSKKGFDFCFDDNACASCPGKCCRGESGYIFIGKKDIEAISSFLKISCIDFLEQYTCRTDYRVSLVEHIHEAEFICVFFDAETCECTIYPVRPNQCKSFPFWDRFREDMNDFDLTRCPGIIKS